MGIARQQLAVLEVFALAFEAEQRVMSASGSEARRLPGPSDATWLPHEQSIDSMLS
jgi:hypothetical protein